MNKIDFKDISLDEIDFSKLTDQQLIEVEKLIEENTIEKAREHFYTYVKYMAEETLPTDFIDGVHIGKIANELQKIEASVVSGNPERLQIFLPPGSMKSKLHVLFVTWCLGRHPNWHIISVGHGSDFAEDNYGRPVRDILESEIYRKIFIHTRLKKEARSARRIETTKKGRYITTGAAAKIAGKRGHIILCDDTISDNDAFSKTLRNKINNWYERSLRSRLLPEGAEVVINTRWHLNDLSGFLLELDKNTRPWNVIKVPAILDEESARYLGRMDRVGESFWPELWPTRLLLEKKATMVPSDWNALYQQNPVPEGGSLVKEEWLEQWEYRDWPELEYIVASLDTAFSENERADPSAITVWGFFTKRDVNMRGREVNVPCAILLHAERDRWNFPDLVEQTRKIYEEFEPDAMIIEKKASGQSLLQEMRSLGYPVQEFSPDRSKEARLHACLPFFANKRIHFPKVFNQELVFSQDVQDELIQFPFAAHDDYVDTTTQALLYARNFHLLNHQKDIDEEDEDDYRHRKRATYWSARTAK